MPLGHLGSGMAPGCMCLGINGSVRVFHWLTIAQHFVGFLCAVEVA